MSNELTQMQNDLLRNLFLSADKELVESLIKEREEMVINLQKKPSREVIVELEATYTTTAELRLSVPDHIEDNKIKSWLGDNEDLWLEQLEEDIADIHNRDFLRGDDVHQFIVYENDMRMFNGYL